MKLASIKQGSGPGSSISLDQETIRVRNAVIKRFIDKPIDELNQFIEMELQTEIDETKRLGILAARIYILRMNISKISEFNENSSLNSVQKVTPKDLVNHINKNSLNPDLVKSNNLSKLEEWTELKMVEPGEVNGVRFPKGITITVGPEDASKLINSGKAILTSKENKKTNDSSIKENNDHEKNSELTASKDNQEEIKNEKIKELKEKEQFEKLDELESNEKNEEKNNVLLETEDLGSKKEE